MKSIISYNTELLNPYIFVMYHIICCNKNVTEMRKQCQKNKNIRNLLNIYKKVKRILLRFI